MNTPTFSFFLWIKACGLVLLLVVASTASAQVDLDAGLVGWYPFDADSGQDASGRGNHPDFYQATDAPDRFGLANRAISLNGTNDYISVPDGNGDFDFDHDDEFSVAFWMARDFSFSLHDQIIVSKSDDASPAPFSVEAYESLGGGIVVSFDRDNQFGGCSSTSTGFGVDATHAFTYQFMVFQKVGDSLFLYRNGQLIIEGEDPVANPACNPANGLPMLIGGENQGFDHFWGDLDDLRIYNRPLSTDEIRALYRLDAVNTFRDTIQAGESYAFNGQQLTSGGVYTDLMPDGSEVTLDLFVSDPAQVDLNAGLVGWYPFDADNGQDASGRGNHPDFYQATDAPDRFGLANRAISLNGTNDYISVPDGNGDFDFDHDDEFSVAFWVAVDAGQQFSGILNKWQGSGSSPFDVDVEVNSEISAQRIPDNCPVGAYLISPGAATYQFMVFQKVGDSLFWYRNGQLVDSGEDPAATPACNPASGEPMLIGLDPAAVVGGHFAGDLDDLRIYNRPLSANEIRALYRLDAVNTFRDTICAGESYAFNGQQLTSGGFYTDLMPDGSVVGLDLFVSEPIINVTAIEPACPGENGQIAFTASGGVPPYSYFVNGLPFSGNVLDTTAGLYDIEVTDAATCGNFTINAEITEFAPLTLDTTQAIVGCDGDLHLSIFDVLGGLAPFEVSVNGSLTDTILSSMDTATLVLENGSYFIQIEDSAGCDTSLGVAHTAQPAVSATLTAAPLGCAGDSLGSLTLTDFTGTGPFYVSISESDETFVADTANVPGTSPLVFDDDLAVGSYLFSIEDANGCLFSGSFDIPPPVPPLQLLVDTIVNATCNGGTDGEVGLQALGGVPPYRYRLGTGGPFAPGSTFPNLEGGSHEFQVQDANGCIGSRTVAVYEGDLALFEQVDPIRCAGEQNGSLAMVAQGGSGLYNFLITRDNVTMLQESGTTSPLVSLDSLGAGVYSLELTDDTGCAATRSVTLNEPDPVEFETLSADTATDCTVDNGSVEFALKGGNGGYSVWFGGAPLSPSADGSFEVDSLGYGIYPIAIEDTKGCVASDTITFTPPNAPTLNLLIDSVTCTGDSSGEIRVVVTNDPEGGNSFTLALDSLTGASATVAIGDTATFPELTAGNYIVLVKNNSTNCVFSEVATVYTPDPLRLSVDSTLLAQGYCVTPGEGSLKLQGSGGTGAYYYEVLNDSLVTLTGSLATGLDTTLYQFRLTDDAGCSDTADFQAYALPEIVLDSALAKPLCQSGAITLRATPEGGVFSGDAIAQAADGSYRWFTESDSLGLAPITYRYTETYLSRDGDMLQCSDTLEATLELVGQPVANFAMSDKLLCPDANLVIHDSSIVPIAGTDSVSWRWTFGDGDSLTYDTQRDTIQHRYTRMGTFPLRLEVSSHYGETTCTDALEQPVTVDESPSMEVNWNGMETGLCYGERRDVTIDLSDNSGEAIFSLFWRASNGLETRDDTLFTGTFNQYGEVDSFLLPDSIADLVSVNDLPQPLTLSLLLDQGDGSCVTEQTIRVPVLPVVVLDPGEVYREEFVSDSGSWTSLRGPGLWTWDPDDSEAGAWQIELDDNGTYPISSSDRLYSPCFRLAELPRPYLGLRFWSETDFGSDGTHLQYSDDGGEHWHVLGERDDEFVTGPNWYDAEEVFALDEQAGWTGETDHREGLHRLDVAGLDRDTTLRLRLTFASDERSDSASALRGFALHEVVIGQRQRQVLIERFLPTDQPETEADLIEALTTNQGGDFHFLRYDLSGPYHEANPTPPRVRSLYYGLSEGETWIIDGRAYLPSEIADTIQAQNRLNLRSLVTPEARYLRYEDGKLTLELPDSLWEDLALRLALVENLPDRRGMVRALLPDGAGVVIGLEAGRDTSLDLAENFSPALPLLVNIENRDSLYAVAWLQDLQTKEVWQAACIDSVDWETLLPNLTLQRRSRPVAAARPSQLRVYPNPTQNYLTIEWPQPLEEAQPWLLFDTKGRQVLSGQTPVGVQRAKLDLRALSAGLYHLRLPDPTTGRWTSWKVSVLR